MKLRKMQSIISPTPRGPLNRSDLTKYYKSYVKFCRDNIGEKPYGVSSSKSLETLRVASYNIHYHEPYSHSGDGLEGGSNQVACVLRELEADVICLQEVRKPKLFGLPYIHFQDLGFIGNAICSQYPLTELATYELDPDNYEERGLCAATVNHPLGKFRIYNTHLDAFDDTEKTRLHQAFQIEKIFQADFAKFKFENVPLLLMGDFNALHKSSYIGNDPHWAWIKEQDSSRRVTSVTIAMDTLLNEPCGWDDLFAAEPPLVTTWSMRRIDYIMARKGHGLDPHFCYRPWVHYSIASDHLPVGVDITFA